MFEGKGKFATTETKLYVAAVTLSTQDNAKLLQQLKSSFKRTINSHKYESNIKTSFPGVNRLFVLSFENEDERNSLSTYYLPKVEIKDYNVMIDSRNFFDQSINSMTKHTNILEKLLQVKKMVIQLVVC